MRTTTICSYKGGIGKTMTVFNLAYNISAKGYRVLAIDTDAQGDLTYMCQRTSTRRASISNILRGQSIKKNICRSRFRNLDFIPADAQLEEVALDRVDMLKKELEKIKNQYDYILIDCHPSMQIATINAIYAADDVIVPLKPNRFERNGLEIMDSYIRQLQELNPCLRFLGVLVTMYAGRKSQKDTITDLLGRTTYPLLDTVIRAGEAANTSLDVRKPLLLHRRGYAITQDYCDLTEEYLESEGRRDGES